MTEIAEATTSDTAFDPTVALDGLLADVGLSAADAGGRVTFSGQDPIIPARHRLGAAIGIPMIGQRGCRGGDAPPSRRSGARPAPGSAPGGTPHQSQLCLEANAGRRIPVHRAGAG